MRRALICGIGGALIGYVWPSLTNRLPMPARIAIDLAGLLAAALWVRASYRQVRESQRKSRERTAAFERYRALLEDTMHVSGDAALNAAEVAELRRIHGL